MSSYILCTKYFLASLFIFTSISLVSNAETVEVESYGACLVLTSKDDFTDETSTHGIMCNGEGSSNSYGSYTLLVSCSDKIKTAIGLQAGTQFHLEDYIQVKYRFGKDKAEITSWMWANSAAVNFSRGTHDIMVGRLKHAKKGEKFLFQVGDEKGVIEFGGEEGGAVVEYLKRCSKFLD